MLPSGISKIRYLSPTSEAVHFLSNAGAVGKKGLRTVVDDDWSLLWSIFLRSSCDTGISGLCGLSTWDGKGLGKYNTLGLAVSIFVAITSLFYSKKN